MTVLKSLTVAKSLWGVAEAGEPAKWDEMLGRIASEGYSLVETILIFDFNQDPVLFRQLLDKHGLGLIVQLHTGSDWNAFDYCTTCDVDAHVLSFRQLLESCLQHRPKIVNVHSGHDSWDLATAVSYFQQVLAIEQELLVGDHADVLLVHETHRQRLLFSPYQAREVLSHPSLHALKINCDLSHWVCVCEKVFSVDDKRDAWWPAVLALVARHCHLIHGRYGHAEGPQVIDPRADAAKNEVAAHQAWWTAIFKNQQERGVTSVIVTEHGPEPYQSYDTPDGGASSLTDQEKSSLLWDINSFVKDSVSECYNSSLSTS